MTSATSKETLQNVRYGSAKMNQESNSIHIDHQSSGAAVNEASRPSLAKIPEEETKVQELPRSDMNQTPISFGSTKQG